MEADLLTPVVETTAAPKRVLVVDDDPFFRESLQENLIDAGYEALAFDGGEAVLSFLTESAAVELILLDWRMPKMTGIEVLRRLRDGGVETPVIFLTVLSDQMYEEAALIGGAVDFIEKSRSFTILKRRMDLIMEGPKGPRGHSGPLEGSPLAASFVLGSLALQPDSGRACWNGNEVNLTLTEFRIVERMARRAGEDVRYRDIYDLVHGQGFVAGIGEQGYRANVRAFIKRIRSKFRDVEGSFDRIENYPGFGYRWRLDA